MGFWEFIKEFCKAIGELEDLSAEYEDFGLNRNDINLNIENNNIIN